jgi:hypothetical protein
MQARTYVVECRYPDGQEPIVIGPVHVTATSLHEAIGVAWGLIKCEVEEYSGTIDDLDGWEVEPEPPDHPTHAQIKRLQAAIRKMDPDARMSLFDLDLETGDLNTIKGDK